MGEKPVVINEMSKLPLSLVGVLLIVTFSVGVTYATIIQVKDDVVDLKKAVGELTKIAGKLSER